MKLWIVWSPLSTDQHIQLIGPITIVKWKDNCIIGIVNYMDIHKMLYWFLILMVLKYKPISSFEYLELFKHMFTLWIMYYTKTGPTLTSIIMFLSLAVATITQKWPSYKWTGIYSETSTHMYVLQLQEAVY